MASIKTLKKLVNSTCLQVVYECFSFLEYTPSLNQENTQMIISEAIVLRNELIHKINCPDKNSFSHNGQGNYYAGIKKKLFNETGKLIERLNSLPR
jgi:hypothetical protein